MLEVTVASTDRDLTTTGYLRARVYGATSTTTADDEVFGVMIRAASRWVESYVGYPLTVQTYRQTLPSYGTRTLVLGRAPVRAVSALYASTSTGDDAESLASSEYRVEDREAGFLTRDEGWSWSAPIEYELDARPLPGQETLPWLVDYVAGWTRDGVDTGSPNWSTEQGTTSTGRTLPEDVEEAVLFRAKRLYEESVGGGVAESEQLGDLRVNYRSGATDRAGGAASPLAVEELLLDPYRRLV